MIISDDSYILLEWVLQILNPTKNGTPPPPKAAAFVRGIRAHQNDRVLKTPIFRHYPPISNTLKQRA